MAKKSNKILNFFKDVKSELKKVVWPNFKRVKNNTIIVIVSIILVGAFICLCDWVFDGSLKAVVNKINPPEVVEENAGTETEGTEMTEEEQLEFIKNYYAEYGITFDGEKLTDADGNELTPEEAQAIVEAAEDAKGTTEE